MDVIILVLAGLDVDCIRSSTSETDFRRSADRLCGGCWPRGLVEGTFERRGSSERADRQCLLWGPGGHEAEEMGSGDSGDNNPPSSGPSGSLLISTDSDSFSVGPFGYHCASDS
jgi:hypothetical protein